MSELLCFDPGPHTGVALFRDGALEYTRTLEKLADSSVLDFYLQLQFLVNLRSSTPVIIVVENFHTVGPLTKDGLATVKIMGWIEGLAIVGGHELSFQMPSVKKPWLDEAARLVKEHKGTRHERDAVAHGLAWLYRAQEGKTK